jgi:hypothetical protein
LRLTGPATDDAGMQPARTTALILGILAAAVCGAGCGDHHPRAPVVVPADVHLASGTARAAPAAVPTADSWPGAAVSPGADRLEAARTVALYCRLIEAGQFARAGELCTHRRLWSRRALGALTRFHFRSARVYAAPDARTLVLKARVRVHARRSRPLPDGLAVLFFTLGRVGDTVGGWLITAVSTSP